MQKAKTKLLPSHLWHIPFVFFFPKFMGLPFTFSGGPKSGIILLSFLPLPVQFPICWYCCKVWWLFFLNVVSNLIFIIGWCGNGGTKLKQLLKVTELPREAEPRCKPSFQNQEAKNDCLKSEVADVVCVFLKYFMYLRERQRERQSMSMSRGKRRGRGRSRLPTAQGVWHGTPSQDPEIMSWAEGRRLMSHPGARWHCFWREI